VEVKGRRLGRRLPSQGTGKTDRVQGTLDELALMSTIEILEHRNSPANTRG